MTFPAVQTTSTKAAGFVTAPVSVTLPTGIAIGDILVVEIIRGGGAQTFSASGWTALEAGHATNASTTIVGFLWKVADGSEGATLSIASTLATSQNTSALCYRISPGQSVEISTVVDGSSTAPDPASLSPSWGSADTLWIASFAAGGKTVSSYPTNYTTDQISTGGVAMATRQLTASSEDPGAFAFAGITNWSAYTLAVQPASSAAPFIPVNWGLPPAPPSIPSSQARGAFVGAFPAVPPQRPPTWPQPVAAYWKAQPPYSQPSPGALQPPFIPSSQPLPKAYPPPFPVPATPAFVGAFPAVAPQRPPTWPPPQGYPPAPLPIPAQPAFVGQFPAVPPQRPFTWPAPQSLAWQPQQQIARPFLGLSVVIIAPPFIPYPWPSPQPVVFRPQPQQAWYNPTAAAVVSAPFAPFSWPRPIEAQWKPQQQPIWFNPGATTVIEVCPPLLTTTVVRGASMASGIVQGSAKFASTISGQARLNSSRKKC